MVAVLHIGVMSLPSGRRRDLLDEDIERRILPLFAGRVLPFDLAASQAYAGLMAMARGNGLAIAASDG